MALVKGVVWVGLRDCEAPNICHERWETVDVEKCLLETVNQALSLVVNNVLRVNSSEKYGLVGEVSFLRIKEFLKVG